MALVKLELQTKTDEELRDFALAHKSAMSGNADFPTPEPSAADFDLALNPLVADLAEEAQLEADLITVRTRISNISRPALETALNARGRHVQTKSGGVASKITSTAMAVQSAGTPTTSLSQPQNLVATTGDNDGEVDVSVNRLPRASSYIWERCEHIDGQPPGPWVQCKVGGRSKTTVTGLVPGRKYAFRVRCLGPNETESPWSDEAVCMAA